MIPLMTRKMLPRCLIAVRAITDGGARFPPSALWTAGVARPPALCPKHRSATPPHIVDLMAGTGEAWPHLLRRFPRAQITAIDISHQMHVHALQALHSTRADRIQHLEVNALTTPLPDAMADVVFSTFGLKTFDADQHQILAQQVARLLRPGGLSR